jgi:hypothetical protein
LSSYRVQLELALPRQEARDVAPYLADASRVREPAGGVLEAQVEQLLPQLFELAADVGLTEGSQLLLLHR